MARVTVVPETIDYPDSDGLPMAENESQFWPILYVGSALDRYYQDREDVYVVGNLLLYYQEGNPREGDFGKSVSPDLMVVLGAPKHVRSSYRAVGGTEGAGLCPGDRLREHLPDRPGVRSATSTPAWGFRSTGSTTRWATILTRRCWAFGLSGVVMCRSPPWHRRVAC